MLEVVPLFIKITNLTYDRYVRFRVVPGEVLRLAVKEVDESGAHDDDQGKDLGIGEVVLKKTVYSSSRGEDY